MADSNPVSENMTPQTGEIAISDMNVTTRQYVDATGGGRSGTPLAGFEYNSTNSIGVLKDWFGRMYKTSATHGTNSLICGPHSANRFPGWDGVNMVGNTVPAGRATAMSDFRDYTPITIMTRTQARTQNEPYYDGNDGRIVCRVYGGGGLNQLFTINIAGTSQTWSSGGNPAGWWENLGSAQEGWNAYRVTVSWTVGNSTASIGNINVGIGTEPDGTCFFGRYGWSAAPTMFFPTEWVGNYVAAYYSVFTTKWSLLDAGTTSERYTTGGGQAWSFSGLPPQVGTTQEQHETNRANMEIGWMGQDGFNSAEFFHDWFSVTSTNKLRLEVSSDDTHSIWIHDVDGNELFNVTDHPGWFAETTPRQYDFTPPYAGNFQITIQVKETAECGCSPVWVGAVIWDHVEHGNDGPPIIATIKTEFENWPDGRTGELLYSTTSDVGLVWNSRMSMRFPPDGSITSGIFCNSLFHTFEEAQDAGLWQNGWVASSTGDSDRMWWLSQQDFIRSEPP